jgi:hypothetical protein
MIWKRAIAVARCDGGVWRDAGHGVRCGRVGPNVFWNIGIGIEIEIDGGELELASMV